MIGDRIIEINEFKLSYDGLFLLEFEYAKEKYYLKPYLSPEKFLKIIQNEGFNDSIQSLDFYSDGVKITKTTLLFEVFNTDNNKISFLTSEKAEHYQDSGLLLIDCKIKNDK